MAVLVTDALPKDMPCFGLCDGVWVCTFSEVKALTGVLREGILRLGELRTHEENKGDKMHLLYNYLTSAEFRLHVEAILGAFQTLKGDLEREKRVYKKLWAAREKQLDCVLDNTLQFYGSVRGIAGKGLQEIEALELDGALLLEETLE